MLFTSEQVSWGHPDKLCDQISDAILDEYLKQDPFSRVAVETLIKDNHVVLAGEVTSKGVVDRKSVVCDILYTRSGMKCQDLDIYDFISAQSPDIAQGVDTGGAGDQGIMFGYACNETEQCLPAAYMMATEALAELQVLNSPILGDDAKSQVTVKYENGKLTGIDTFLLSTQHIVEATQEDVKTLVVPIMKEVAEHYGMNTDFKVLVNPTGKFVVGGSFGDAGVTGRKIIADTYGGYGHHGGGAFSGKDPTKVDRSAAYMARYIAKYLLLTEDLDECEVQLGYAIGVAEPVSLNVTAKVGGKLLTDTQFMEKFIRKEFDLTPNGIIKFLNLRTPIYLDTASLGHFTDPSSSWERVVKVW